MRSGTKVRQSPRLHIRDVEEGECSRRTRSMKKKARALSPVKLNFSKRPRSSVKNCEGSGSKSNSDSDFECMNEKGKSEVVVDYKKHTDLEVDARIQRRSRFLKIWDFYYDENNRNFHGKATYWNDYTVPQKIGQKLTGSQFHLFMLTPFSHFMKLVQPKMYSQLIHQALVREIYQRDKGEVWFEFGEKRVRFGLPEFCLISGMNGSGNADVSGYSGKKSVLVAKYFGESRVTRAVIESVYEETSFDNDEEAVRLSVIFLLFNFLLAAAPPRYVDMDLLTYAAIGDLNVFPWGKVCFDQIVRSLSIAVKGSARRLKSGFVVYNIFKERYTKLYKLSGFSYCFQVFLYETIPTLKDRGYCVRKGVSKSRILAWKEIGKSPTNEQLNDFVFGSGEMRVQFMKPSVEESCEMSFLDGFRFLEVSEGVFGVDYNIDAKGKIMCSGSFVSSGDIKRMLDERLKPFEDSISCVKETTELLKKDVREQLQVFEGNIIKQIQDFLRVVCPEKFSNVKNSERDKSSDEVPLENDCLDCLVSGGKCKSCGHLPVNVTHFSELNGIHTCDAVGNGVSGPDVEKLSKVIEFQNEPTLIVKEANSVARDMECRKQSDVGSNLILVGGVRKVREFPSFELLSQESLSDGQHLDSEKRLDIGDEGNAMVENEEQQESSPRSKSHFDDIIFTTQDIVMIDEMEHSVERKDVLDKRAVVRSSVLRSPYTTDFGSAECKELVLYPKDIRKGISAFPDECMKFPDAYEVSLFDEWFKIGFNSRKRVYKFPGSSDNIIPSFSFGDTRVSSKMWFYSLLTPNKWLNNDHINIAFYYLRKLARHSPKVRVKVTTVDSWFHVKITNLYKEYIMKCFHKYVLTGQNDIREYVLGYLMCINTPWAEVDYVLFPINMDKPDHWYLLIFDIRRRLLVLYNTLEPGSAVMKSKLKEVCEPYIFALPVILSSCGFWKSRNDIDRTSSSFTKYGLEGPLELEVAKDVIEQLQCDCGVFTIGYAEHFIFQKMEDMLTRFSVEAYRKKLCVNLYVHATNKAMCGYESDIEHPGRFVGSAS
ncbi:hypothetical protein OROGR_014223 [Orobanche gracilis]